MTLIKDFCAFWDHEAKPRSDQYIGGLQSIAEAAHEVGLESPFAAASISEAFTLGRAAIGTLEAHKAAPELRRLVIMIDAALNELTGEGIETFANAAKEAKE